MSRKKLRQFYTEFHGKEGKYGGKTGGRERVSLLKEFIGTGKRVLDLGCRDGSLTQHYVEGNEVVGADIDDTALAICGKDLGIETHHLDLNDDFPFDNASFDVVVACEIVEHVMVPDYFVKEVRRLLKPGGTFCGTVPNDYRLLMRLDYLKGKPFADPSHLHHFSYDTLRQLLEKYFTAVEIVPFHGHIIGNDNFGIPVRRTSPVLVGKLFSRHLFWKALRQGLNEGE